MDATNVTFEATFGAPGIATRTERSDSANGAPGHTRSKMEQVATSESFGFTFNLGGDVPPDLAPVQG